VAWFKRNSRFINDCYLKLVLHSLFSVGCVSLIFYTSVATDFIFFVVHPFFWVDIYSDSSVVVRQLKDWKDRQGGDQKVCLCH
jgi:hypothetical protein